MAKTHEETRGGLTGRRKAFTLRVNDALYEKILDAAEENGRSLAAEAEHRIARSLEMDEGRGGRQIAALLDYLGASAQLVQSQPLDEDRSEWQRYEALRELFTGAVKKYLPAPRALPQYLGRLNELVEREPELLNAATKARQEMGGKDYAKPGLFGGGRPRSALSVYGEPRVPDPARFPATPPTNPIEFRSTEDSQGESGPETLKGLLASVGYLSSSRLQPNVRAGGGEVFVENGAVDALKQEETLPCREGKPVADAEWEWAKVHDEITALLQQYRFDKDEAKAIGHTVFERVRSQYEMERADILAAYRDALKDRGVEPE